MYADTQVVQRPLILYTLPIVEPSILSIHTTYLDVRRASETIITFEHNINDVSIIDILRINCFSTYDASD